MIDYGYLTRAIGQADERRLANRAWSDLERRDILAVRECARRRCVRRSDVIFLPAGAGAAAGEIRRVADYAAAHFLHTQCDQRVRERVPHTIAPAETRSERRIAGSVHDQITVQHAILDLAIGEQE